MVPAITLVFELNNSTLRFGRRGSSGFRSIMVVTFQNNIASGLWNNSSPLSLRTATMIGTTLVEHVFIRRRQFCISADPLGASFLCFGLSAEGTLRGTLNFCLHQPKTTRNTPQCYEACQTPSAHTGAAQGARKEVYQSPVFRSYSTPLPPGLTSSLRLWWIETIGVVLLGYVLFNLRRRGGVHIGSWRISERNGTARWDQP